MRNLALIASIGVAAACSPPHVQQFPEKPPNCPLELVKTLPERPYVEIETLQLPSLESLGDVIDHVHAQACRDGADAVYAPKGGRVYSYAIILKWNDPPAAAPAAPVAAPPEAPAPADPQVKA
jgi:hypothetical protein